MKTRTLIALLLLILLLCLLPAMTLALKTEEHVESVPAAEGAPLPSSEIPETSQQAAEIADQIQPDSGDFPEVVIPSEPPVSEPEQEPILVAAGDTFYAYEGMTVRTDGGTVYSTGATVTNVGGTVFCSGGTVHNFGGTVYARAGTVFNHAGTVYNDGADIIVLPEDDPLESHIYGYYELKLAGYYEPYVTMEGVVNEPGAESMIISEDSVCRIIPKQNFRILDAETTSGELTRNDADGSVTLQNVTGDTLLTLKIESVVF